MGWAKRKGRRWKRRAGMADHQTEKSARIVPSVPIALDTPPGLRGETASDHAKIDELGRHRDFR